MKRLAIIFCLLFASIAMAQVPPYALDVKARFRTVESIGVLDDFAVNDFLQDGEKVYVKGEGVFVWDYDDVSTVDNKTIFDAGAIGGRFFREPVGEILQHTTAERNNLRFAVGKSHVIHDSDQDKAYLAIGTGLSTAPTYVDLAGTGGGGGSSIIESNQTATASRTHDFAATTQTWNNFASFIMKPPAGQRANIVFGEDPNNGVQTIGLYAPQSLTSDITICLPETVPPVVEVPKMLTITSHASSPATIEWQDIGGGGGVVNLGFTPSPTNGVVTNDAGTNATILAADSVNAGLLLPGEKDQIADHQSIFGVGAGNTTFGAFPGDLLTSNSNAYTLFAILESDAEAQQGVIGLAQGAADLGTFTGVTISDNTDIKTALQELETVAESAASGAITVDKRTWSVVGSTGTITLSAAPADPEKVRFVMWSGLTFMGTNGGVGQVNVVGTTATIDADDYGINDGERVLVEYEQ